MSFRNLPLLSLFMISSHLFAQGFVDPEYQPPCGKKVHREIQPFIDHLFCWKDWEIDKTDEQKKTILDNLVYDKTISMHPNLVHVLDYNRDGLEDFIYQDLSDWKSKRTLFWLNIGGQWKPDFRIDGEIIEMGETNGKPWFIIYHHLCCGDYTGYVKRLTPSENGGSTFQVSEIYGFIDEFRRMERTTGHEVVFDQNVPVSFNDQDTLYSAFGQIHGFRRIIQDRRFFNPVMHFHAQSSGVILTEFTDNKGQLWYYVRLDRNTSFSLSAFERDHRRSSLPLDPALRQYMGWVKASDNLIK